MNDYNFEKGAIWEVFYLTKEDVILEPNLEQTLVDEDSRKILQDTFDPPPGLTPSDYSVLFMQHFMKTREKSREMIGKNNKKYTRWKMLTQLGNRECLQDLYNTELLTNFDSWENPTMIEFFKNLSAQYLNDSK